MAGPDHIPFVDTSVAVARLRSGQARVRQDWHLSAIQRRELSDKLLPHDITPDFSKAIEWAIVDYRKQGLIKRVCDQYRVLKRPMFVARIEAAKALEQLLDPMIDRDLVTVLRKAIGDWLPLADLIPGNPRHRPSDAAMTRLGVAVADALDREGIPLETNGRSRTVLMEVLDFARAYAEPHSKALGIQGSAKFAEKVLKAYDRRLQK